MKYSARMKASHVDYKFCNLYSSSKKDYLRGHAWKWSRANSSHEATSKVAAKTAIKLLKNNVRITSQYEDGLITAEEYDEARERLCHLMAHSPDANEKYLNRIKTAE